MYAYVFYGYGIMMYDAGIYDLQLSVHSLAFISMYIVAILMYQVHVIYFYFSFQNKVLKSMLPAVILDMFLRKKQKSVYWIVPEPSLLLLMKTIDMYTSR